MSKTIKIAVADDHRILLHTLTNLLKGEVDFEVVVSASNGQELLTQLKTTDVDVVLLDLDMPVMDGRAVMPVLRQHYSSVKVIILSFYDSVMHIRKFLSEGASAYLSKGIDFGILLNAIRSVFNKGFFLHGLVTTELLADLKYGSYKSSKVIEGDPLTEREQEIVVLICEGKTNCEIGDELCLSKRTVENHRMRISKKIGTNSTAKIVVYAFERGIYTADF